MTSTALPFIRLLYTFCLLALILALPSFAENLSTAKPEGVDVSSEKTAE